MKYNFTLSELKSKDNLKELQETYESLLKTSWQGTETIAFGENLPKNLEFEKFCIVDIKDLYENGVEQTHREYGRSADYDTILKSIDMGGWKAKHVPPQVIRDGTSWKVLTGNTRLQILLSNGVYCIVVAVYNVIAQGEYAIQQAIIEAGQSFNCQSDPASPPSQADIINAVSKLVDLHKKSDGDYGISNDLDKIREKVLELSGPTFARKIRDKLAFSVHNTHNPNGAVAAWQTSGDAKWNVDKAKTDIFKLHDSKDVRYLITTSAKQSYVWIKAIQEANEYPNANIRIVAHTGVLGAQGGYDLEKIYKDRSRNAVKEFDALKREFVSFFLSDVKDKSAKETLTDKFKRISFYGLYPALTDRHNMDAIIHYNSNNKTFTQTQKDASTYSFKLNECDETYIAELVDLLTDE
jgi:hypothetical protein